MKKHDADEDLEPPTMQVILALEVCGFNPEKVKYWSATRAKATLDVMDKQKAIHLRRAEQKAIAEGGRAETPAPKRGFPVPMMRVDMANWLAECNGADELTGALSHAVYELCDSEVKRLAGYLQTILGENDGTCPDALSGPPEATGGDRGSPEAQPEERPARDRPVERPRPARRVQRPVAALPGFDSGDA